MCLSIPCGYSMQTITKVAAYTLIGCSVICAILIGSLSIYLCAAFPDLVKLTQIRGTRKKYRDLEIFLEMHWGIQGFLLSSIFILSILAIYFNIMLLRGATERNLRKISIWLWYSMLNAIVLIPFFIFTLVHFYHQIELWTLFLFIEFCHLFFTTIVAGLYREMISEESYDSLQDWDWKKQEKWFI